MILYKVWLWIELVWALFLGGVFSFAFARIVCTQESKALAYQYHCQMNFPFFLNFSISFTVQAAH